jgi:lauroyl/myristoyl acyltransferase
VESEATESTLPRRRSAIESHKQRLVRTADLREAALLVLYGVTVLILPVAWWTAITSVMHRARRGMKRRYLPKYVERFRAVCGKGVSTAAVRRWCRAGQQHVDRRRLYTVAELLTDRWQPKIKLNGSDAIAAALGEGRGVILWFDSFVHTNLVAKRALHDAGFDMHFLSSRYHGGSASSFGRRFLNPIYVETETRYLGERIVLAEANQVAITRRLLTVLQRNGVVGLTNTVSSNMYFVQTPFGAATRMALPTTILSLALKSGAPILPVATFERSPLQDYSVIIGSPIVPDPSVDKATAIADAARRYVEWLLPMVKDHPEEWTSWKSNRLV